VAPFHKMTTFWKIALLVGMLFAAMDQLGGIAMMLMAGMAGDERS